MPLRMMPVTYAYMPLGPRRDGRVTYLTLGGLRMAEEPLRVLAIHRYYWPDSPPYASLLRVIAEHWSSAGHDVRVLTSQPSYKPEQGLDAAPTEETIDGVVVRRIGMKPDRGGRGASSSTSCAFRSWSSCGSCSAHGRTW